MTLQSPFEDFVATTLSAVPGMLGKLDYLGRLRDAAGKYLHWGLARVHGDSGADQAAAEAHRLLFAKILATPLSALLRDACSCGETQHLAAPEYVQNLRERAQMLLPRNPSRGPALHFNSVLDALSSLARAQRANPGAS